MNENRCVSCGKEIPEGSQVCLGWCKGNVTVADNKPVEELTKGELTNEIVKLGNMFLTLEKEFDKLSVGYLALCKAVGIRH